MTHVDSRERIVAQYLEMPGLRLTASQAERLCGLEPGDCASSLQHLVQVGVLRQSPRGLYLLAASQV